MVRGLVDRAMSGDRDAFAALAAQIGDDLYAIARRILRDRDAAQDAVQAALLQIWRQLPALRDPDRFEAWSYRLLVNSCYRLSRSERRWVTGLSGLPPIPLAADHSQAIADRDAVERAFGTLSPEHRAIVVLHHYRGMPLTEVAAALGIPSGTAYSRLHYAHRRMRSALESPPARVAGGTA
jgi:RNA polymerase sigma-70 factor (ECF subfamily)